MSMRINDLSSDRSMICTDGVLQDAGGVKSNARYDASRYRICLVSKALWKSGLHAWWYHLPTIFMPESTVEAPTEGGASHKSCWLQGVTFHMQASGAGIVSGGHEGYGVVNTPQLGPY